MIRESIHIARPKSLRVEEVRPVAVTEVSAGCQVYDFGRAAFGTVRLAAQVDRPTKAVVHLGEKLDAAGRVDREPPGCIRYRQIPLELTPGEVSLQVVIPPDARNTEPAAVLMPEELFEVLPFRYAELVVDDASAVRVKDLTQLAVFYPFDEQAAGFHCDDDRLNRVWELCKCSIKATSFCGIYVDGDRERIAYEGDAYINQLCHYGVDAEYEMARASIEHLLFHPTWPTEWSLHCVPMAWADYMYTGRIDLLGTYYEVLQRKALVELAREDGLICTETGLVTSGLLDGIFLAHSHPLRDLIDWPPGSFTEGGQGERDNYDMVPVKTVVNAFHAWNLDLLGRAAALLGRAADAVFYRERYAQCVKSLQQVCFDADRGVFVDGEGTDHASLHANMIPAALGLTPAGHAASVAAHIRSRGMACSVYGAQYLLEACYRLGDADHALDLMTAEHDRGWLNMLNVGSTVTLEAWDLRYKNNLDWNHAWGAAPANIIPLHLVGVRPAKPGFAEVLIAPRPGRLRTLHAKVPTPAGAVVVQIDPADRDRRRLRIESPVPIQLDTAGCSTETARPAESLAAGCHDLIIG